MINVRERVVTETWLETVLKECHVVTDSSTNGNDSKNVRLNVNSFKIGKGSENSESVLSELIAASINYQIEGGGEEKSLDLIIKLLPLDPFSRYFVTEAEFDLREIKFYTEVVPDLMKFQKDVIRNDEDLIKLPVPKCYLGKHVPFDVSQTGPDSDDEINESIIVLEDLKKQGYQSTPFKNGLTLEQAKASFVAISKIHSLSLAMKLRERKNLKEKYDFLFQTEKTSLSYQQLMERGFPQLILFLESKSDMKDVIGCLHEIRPKIKHLIEVLLAPKQTISLITHTDFWSNNFLFKKNECAILDWQMVTCSQPTNDLALLIISSLTSKTRRENADKLLECYWENFVENLKRLNVDASRDLNYGLSDLFADYKRSQLLALLLCIGSIDVALKDSDIEERLIDVLIDLHKDGILSPEFVNNL
ncbi:conserved hypothetical protein [Pediculus humanus corporis]|uniref:CHK kinase-like domain-containing protein n=1 Tax=Pediculus humanus subsp. corporis TaxID=121224 RepID=E0VE30_PEDHC|nr:uncharacterized protein Phum_PHUM127990 [Pediculus humanus corporis]EEB11636.1 conserved hypothetical protein [Pediculus humanus corporis]